MKKTIQPARFTHYNGKKYPVFVTIEYNDGKLSMTGVESPLPSGNCRGSCGQIVSNFSEYVPAKGWTTEMLNTLQFIWKTYHLNDTTPNCEHMRDAGKMEYMPGYVCPVCGYKSGSAWLFRPVPTDVIAWLENLPDSPITPAWS